MLASHSCSPVRYGETHCYSMPQNIGQQQIKPCNYWRGAVEQNKEHVISGTQLLLLLDVCCCYVLMCCWMCVAVICCWLDVCCCHVVGCVLRAVCHAFDAVDCCTCRPARISTQAYMLASSTLFTCRHNSGPCAPIMD